MIHQLSATERYQKRKRHRNISLLIAGISILVSVIIFIVSKNALITALSFVGILILASVYLLIRIRLVQAARIKKIEIVFPDFIELMASNLRSGMTIDRALLLSARKEFAPLDKEIISLGKDIVTGKEIGTALKEMAQRIGSDRIRKTIDLLISGIISGGNLSVLLEETAIAMRERMFIEKKASSNVLMYVIFIFFAAGVGAPLLFGLSSVLVKILTGVLATIPPTETIASARLPFTLTSISVSTTFIDYFAVIFLTITNILAALVLGLVNKGSEREGTKYIFPLLAIALPVFFIVKTVLYTYLSGFFAS